MHTCVVRAVCAPRLCHLSSLHQSPRTRASRAPPQPIPLLFNDTATTEIYTLSLHDALPIWVHAPLNQHDDAETNQVANREPEEARQRPRDQIGRASCREECRSRWSPYH